ncbi:hypothetical protein ACTXT7_013689 [Hymenolepis weldensis]
MVKITSQIYIPPSPTPNPLPKFGAVERDEGMGCTAAQTIVVTRSCQRKAAVYALLKDEQHACVGLYQINKLVLAGSSTCKLKNRLWSNCTSDLPSL